MPKTVSFQEFLTRSEQAQKIVHDYSSVVWVNTKTPVVITCLKHGPFTQLPSSHMLGYGCPGCGRDVVEAASTDDGEDFARKAKANRGDSYDISKVKYIRSCVPVEIGCKVPGHGSFWMTPNKFLSGRDCPKCGKMWLQESKLVANTKKFHEDIRDNLDNCDYSLVKYVNAHRKVEIICKHGHPNFFQTPSSHIQGSGCPECAKTGFNPSEPGVLYVLRHGDITKVGITNKSLSRRVRNINRSSGKNFKILTYILFENGQVATDVETALLRKYRSTHHTPTEIYDGYSECFYDVDYSTLLLDIVKFCSSLLSN